MLKDGDRVMVCLSGGKDSLSLLHTMKQYQHYLKKKNISFELGAVTVDPMTPSYDPSPLIKYCAALGVPYAFEQQCRWIFIAQLLIQSGQFDIMKVPCIIPLIRISTFKYRLFRIKHLGKIQNPKFG